MSTRKKILFLAEGATYSHFFRPLLLAEALDPREFEIHFYAPQEYHRFLIAKRFRSGVLPSAPKEWFLERLSRGAPLFSEEVIHDYVLEDRKLLSAIRPDLVIGDLRFSLAISARLESVPYAAIFNAHWSPYAKPRSAIPEIPLTRAISPNLLLPLLKFAEPHVRASHVRQMNRIRAKYGLAPLPLDLGKMYTDADFVLFGDAPEFIPTENSPFHHVYIGPCTGGASIPKPQWWKEMQSDPRPKVFVALGSSGPVRALPAILKALSRFDVATVLSSADQTQAQNLKAAYSAPLIPYVEMSEASRFVITHGGTGGVYPALAGGAPVLAIPGHADQQLTTALVEEHRVGMGIRSELATERRIGSAVESLLTNPIYARNAKHWKEIFSRYDTPKLFQSFIRTVLNEPKRPAPVREFPRSLELENS